MRHAGVAAAESKLAHLDADHHRVDPLSTLADMNMRYERSETNELPLLIFLCKGAKLQALP